MANSISRGIEVLVKKAAVDPAFKKMLLEKRAEAAETIVLKLEPAEAAMLRAVPAKQLEATVANTKVNPSLRPAFLGYAAAVMLAALGTGAYAADQDEWEIRTVGIDPEIPPKTYDRDIDDPQEIDVPDDAGVVTGFVFDDNNQPIKGVLVVIKGANVYASTVEDGSFVISNVPPGTYLIKASRVGYDEHILENVEITVQTITSLKFRLVENKPGTTYITGTRPDLP